MSYRSHQILGKLVVNLYSDVSDDVICKQKSFSDSLFVTECKRRGGGGERGGEQTYSYQGVRDFQRRWDFSFVCAEVCGHTIEKLTHSQTKARQSMSKNRPIAGYVQ